MLERSTLAVSSVMFAYALMGSVVFTGVSLSARLLGHWRVVSVFGQDVSRTHPPLTIELEKSGRLTGRSSCGTFTGSWSTGRNEVRFQGFVPSACNCGELRRVEQRLLEAMATARETKMEKEGLYLIDQGRPLALLVPQRT